MVLCSGRRPRDRRRLARSEDRARNDGEPNPWTGKHSGLSLRGSGGPKGIFIASLRCLRMIGPVLIWRSNFMRRSRNFPGEEAADPRPCRSLPGDRSQQTGRGRKRCGEGIQSHLPVPMGQQYDGDSLVWSQVLAVEHSEKDTNRLLSRSKAFSAN
jgi:hypothetical protein